MLTVLPINNATVGQLSSASKVSSQKAWKNEKMKKDQQPIII